MAVLIITQVTRINEFRNNAHMFQGKGVAGGYTLNTKGNFGLQVAGDFNAFFIGVNTIFDPDVNDTPILDGEFKGFVGPMITEVT